MIKKMQAAMRVMKAGEAVSDPAKWKNRTVKADLVVFVVAVLGALSVFGVVDVDMGEEEVANVVEAVFAILPPLGIIFSAVMHVATSTKIGLHTKSQDSDKKS